MRKSVLIIAAAVLLGAATSPDAQTPPRLTIRLVSPSGNADDISGLTSGQRMEFQFLHEGAFHAFQLVPQVVAEGNPDRVTVTVREGREADAPVVADLYLAVGHVVIETDTSPSFGVAVLQVER